MWVYLGLNKDKFFLDKQILKKYLLLDFSIDFEDRLNNKKCNRTFLKIKTTFFKHKGTSLQFTEQINIK